MKFNKLYIALLFSAVVFSSCSDDEENTPSVEAPESYSFTRDGASSVSYDGQTTRIAMTQELGNAIKDDTKTKEELLAMFAHAAGDADFTDTDLNASDKSIRSKVAASADFFASNTTDAAAIKTQLDTWIENQVDEVFPAWNTTATEGVAGQLVDGGSTRYVSADGLEYNQLLAKSLIGALFADQAINNYLSTAVLDAGTNQEDNDADAVEDGKNYTSMEHKWDEAYGYLYGAAEGKSYLLSYIDQVAENENYSTVAEEIKEAFILGRAAIVAKNYTLRDEQAEIIRANVSKVIAVRAIHYLQAGKDLLAADDFGGAFHDLSEGLGFVYSLQFTRKPNAVAAYFTKADVDGFFDDILENDNGLWNVSGTTLDAVSNEIADAFGLNLEEASL